MKQTRKELLYKHTNMYFGKSSLVHVHALSLFLSSYLSVSERPAMKCVRICVTAPDACAKYIIYWYDLPIKIMKYGAFLDLTDAKQKCTCNTFPICACVKVSR